MNILLAEDNPANEAIAVLMLKLMELVPDVARNGVEVLHACEKQQYDIILMDLNMPVLDGFETTEALNQRHSEGAHRPRIIPLTANVLQATRDRCAELGMENFIAKPLRLETLRTVISHQSQADEPLVESGDIDFSMFDSIMTGEMGAMCRPHYDAMIEELHNSYVRLDELALQEQQRPLADLLHSLRGSCGMFGLVKVCKILGAFENVAKANSVEHAPGLFDELKQAAEAGFKVLNHRLEDS